MYELEINGSANVCGFEVPKIAGGFGRNKRSMLIKHVSEMHGKQIKHVNESIKNHREKFKDGIDVIDLKKPEHEKFVVELVDHNILTKMEVAKADNIFIVSERGYAKLLKIFDDDLAWDKYEEILDGYFRLMEESQSDELDKYLTMDEEDRAIAYFNERKNRKQLESVNEELIKQQKEKEEQINELKPKAALATMVVSAKNAQSMAVVCRVVGMGRTTLFRFLREKKIIMPNTRIPYQKYIDAGYFIVKESPHQEGDEIVNEAVTRVTAKGLELIVKLVKEEREGEDNEQTRNAN